MNAFEKLTLNGVTYLRDELLHLTDQKMKHADSDEDEFEVYSFIHKWVSPGETLDVQTSGSTGAPRLQTFPKHQFIESAKLTCEYFGLKEGMNMLHCLSAEYIAGKMMIVRAFVSGANLIVVSPSGNPLLNVEDKIDFTAMVPLQAQNAISDSNTNAKFSAISSVIIGGASIPVKLEHQLETFPNNVYATFAMTETLSHIALRKITGKGKKGLYELLPNISIAEDERGCMVIKAEHLGEEPIVTNDIIVKADETHFHWMGRYDNVINSGGVKVYPETVEEKIAHLLPSNRFFISSLPDETLGQKVVMVIESQDGFDITHVKAEIEKLVDKYDVPKQYFIISQFAETPNGKIQRQESLKLALK
jgi:O-succinylbenzoic acid--CoA ligase